MAFKVRTKTWNSVGNTLKVLAQNIIQTSKLFALRDLIKNSGWSAACNLTEHNFMADDEIISQLRGGLNY